MRPHKGAQAMIKFFRQVLNDLKQRRFVAEYSASLAIVVVLALELFSDLLSEQIVLNIMLAVLLVLLLDITTRNRGEQGLDAYLHTRDELGPFRERLKNARRVWIFAASAANILGGENLDAIRTHIMARKDGELRVVVLDPGSKAVSDAKRQIDDHITYQIQELREELRTTLTSRFDRIRSWKLPGKFEARVLDFNPGISMVIIDAFRSSGQAVVEIYGFGQESTNNRMSVEIKADESAVWFDYWTDQYERMWEIAKPLESLGGAPDAG